MIIGMILMAISMVLTTNIAAGSDYHPFCARIASKLKAKQNQCINIHQQLENAENRLRKKSLANRDPRGRLKYDTESLRDEVRRLRDGEQECIREADKLVDLHTECNSSYREAQRKGLGAVAIWAQTWSTKSLEY